MYARLRLRKVVYMNSFSWKSITKIMYSIGYIAFAIVASIGVYFSSTWIVMLLFQLFVHIAHGSSDGYLIEFFVIQVLILCFAVYVFYYAIKALIQVYKTNESNVPIFGYIAILMLIRD